MELAAKISGLIGVAVAASVLIALSLVVTNPDHLGPIGVTVWFVILLAAASSLMTLGLFFAKSFLKVHDARANRLRYSMRQGLLIAGWATALLALASLGQLGPKDAILLGLLLVIIELYIRLRFP